MPRAMTCWELIHDLTAFPSAVEVFIESSSGREQVDMDSVELIRHLMLESDSVEDEAKVNDLSVSEVACDATTDYDLVLRR